MLPTILLPLLRRRKGRREKAFESYHTQAPRIQRAHSPHYQGNISPRPTPESYGSSTQRLAKKRNETKRNDDKCLGHNRASASQNRDQGPQGKTKGSERRSRRKAPRPHSLMFARRNLRRGSRTRERTPFHEPLLTNVGIAIDAPKSRFRKR